MSLKAANQCRKKQAQASLRKPMLWNHRVRSNAYNIRLLPYIISHERLEGTLRAGKDLWSESSPAQVFLHSISSTSVVCWLQHFQVYLSAESHFCITTQQSLLSSKQCYSFQAPKAIDTATWFRYQTSQQQTSGFSTQYYYQVILRTLKVSSSN